ncbi:MAG: PTS sugar transporter subunit IIA [Candidatus Eiseniibacteriota bacterium]
MRLSEKLDARRIRIPHHAKTKADGLRELVTLLPGALAGARGERILGAVLDRERRMSTGIGRGVAIPHGKSELVGDMEIAFGVSPQPIDFQSLDGAPCSVFFLLVSPPEMAGAHIQALAAISRMLASDSLLGELRRVSDAEQVKALFRREETLHPG